MSHEHLQLNSMATIVRAPMQHVTLPRMREVTELLANTQLSIAEIAKDVGYSASNPFSDTFCC